MSWLDVLNNGWFVGIVGGVISGVAVYPLTNLFVRKKEKRVYKEKLNLANSELLNSLKPMVKDETTFNIELYKTVARAVSERHSINQPDLYSFKTVLDLIVTEIMQSQFLTYEQKKKYADTLIDVINEADSKQLLEQFLVDGVKAQNSNSSIASKVSLITAVSTGSVALTSSLFNDDKFKAMSIEIGSEASPLWFLLLIVLVPMVVTVSSSFISDYVEYKNKKRNKNNLANKDKDDDKNLFG